MIKKSTLNTYAYIFIKQMDLKLGNNLNKTNCKNLLAIFLLKIKINLKENKNFLLVTSTKLSFVYY